MRPVPINSKSLSFFLLTFILIILFLGENVQQKQQQRKESFNLKQQEEIVNTTPKISSLIITTLDTPPTYNDQQKEKGRFLGDKNVKLFISINFFLFLDIPQQAPQLIIKTQQKINHQQFFAPKPFRRSVPNETTTPPTTVQVIINKNI
jgi:hypothetical protein